MQEQFAAACESLASSNSVQRKQAEEYLNALTSRDNAQTCLPVCRSLLQTQNVSPVITFHALAAVKLIIVRDYSSVVLANEWMYFLLDSLCSLHLASVPQFVKGQYLQAIALIAKRAWLDDAERNDALANRIWQMATSGNGQV
jgi:hypothetical protein